jgi:hypothetical protein
MPSSTARASTSTSLSSLPIWDPETAFAITNPNRGKLTCVGYAPSKRRRCENGISGFNETCARPILKRLSRQYPSRSGMKDDLKQLAQCLLCRKYPAYHYQSQVDDMIKKWNVVIRQEQRRIEEEEEETEQEDEIMDDEDMDDNENEDDDEFTHIIAPSSRSMESSPPDSRADSMSPAASPRSDSSGRRETSAPRPLFRQPSAQSSRFTFSAPASVQTTSAAPPTPAGPLLGQPSTAQSSAFMFLAVRSSNSSNAPPASAPSRFNFSPQTGSSSSARPFTFGVPQTATTRTAPSSSANPAALTFHPFSLPNPSNNSSLARSVSSLVQSSNTSTVLPTAAAATTLSAPLTTRAQAAAPATQTPPAAPSCTLPHSTRRPINDGCPVCTLDMVHTPLNRLVWCRNPATRCGQSVHRTCFETWQAECERNRNRVTCVYWYVWFLF